MGLFSCQGPGTRRRITPHTIPHPGQNAPCARLSYPKTPMAADIIAPRDAHSSTGPKEKMR